MARKKLRYTKGVHKKAPKRGSSKRSSASQRHFNLRTFRGSLDSRQSKAMLIAGVSLAIILIFAAIFFYKSATVGQAIYLTGPEGICESGEICFSVEDGLYFATAAEFDEGQEFYVDVVARMGSSQTPIALAHTKILYDESKFTWMGTEHPDFPSEKLLEDLAEFDPNQHFEDLQLVTAGEIEYSFSDLDASTIEMHTDSEGYVALARLYFMPVAEITDSSDFTFKINDASDSTALEFYADGLQINNLVSTGNNLAASVKENPTIIVPQWHPENGGVHSKDSVFIYFSESIDYDASAYLPGDVFSFISSGQDIPFTVSFPNPNIIKLTPTSFIDGLEYTVGIEIPEAIIGLTTGGSPQRESITFTYEEANIADLVSPEVKLWSPTQGAEVTIDHSIKIEISEEVVFRNGNIINDQNVGSLITLKDIGSGVEENFIASIQGNIIDIIPQIPNQGKKLLPGREYKLIFKGNYVEDLSGNVGQRDSVTFTTKDESITSLIVTGPLELLSSSPENGESDVLLDSPIILTFNKAVRNVEPMEKAVTISDADTGQIFNFVSERDGPFAYRISNPLGFQAGKKISVELEKNSFEALIGGAKLASNVAFTFTTASSCTSTSLELCSELECSSLGGIWTDLACLDPFGDEDGDLVLNGEDSCPGSSGLEVNNGCPIVEFEPGQDLCDLNAQCDSESACVDAGHLWHEVLSECYPTLVCSPAGLEYCSINDCVQFGEWDVNSESCMSAEGAVDDDLLGNQLVMDYEVVVKNSAGEIIPQNKNIPLGELSEIIVTISSSIDLPENHLAIIQLASGEQVADVETIVSQFMPALSSGDSESISFTYEAKEETRHIFTVQLWSDWLSFGGESLAEGVEVTYATNS